jgi:hypothetical protein
MKYRFKIFEGGREKEELGDNNDSRFPPSFRPLSVPLFDRPLFPPLPVKFETPIFGVPVQLACLEFEYRIQKAGRSPAYAYRSQSPTQHADHFRLLKQVLRHGKAP